MLGRENYAVLPSLTKTVKIRHLGGKLGYNRHTTTSYLVILVQNASKTMATLPLPYHTDISIEEDGKRLRVWPPSCRNRFPKQILHLPRGQIDMSALTPGSGSGHPAQPFLTSHHAAALSHSRYCPSFLPYCIKLINPAHVRTTSKWGNHCSSWVRTIINARKA
jgi:hypothetical protein